MIIPLVAERERVQDRDIRCVKKECNHVGMSRRRERGWTRILQNVIALLFKTGRHNLCSNGRTARCAKTVPSYWAFVQLDRIARCGKTKGFSSVPQEIDRGRRNF